MFLINEQLFEPHYKINVRPLTYKLLFEQKEGVKTFALADGTTAYCLEIAAFHLLVFEKNNWKYTLSVDKRVSYIVQSETLVYIANSIHY